MSLSPTRKLSMPLDTAEVVSPRSLAGTLAFDDAEESHMPASGVEETPYAPVVIGPLSIDALDLPQLTRRLVVIAKSAIKTHHVITANAQFYNLAEQRPDFQACTARAEYVCADGISVVMACRLFGKAPVVRVPGVELVEQLCKQAALHGLSVYFLGGKQGSAEKATSILAERYPGFKPAGISCPPYDFEQNEALLHEVLEDVSRVKPAIIFVALGAPRQEFFIDQHIRALGVPVAIGVGGSFEMIAGLVHRAPLWVQAAGLEWAYRWVQEPRRLARRYLVGNLKFMYYVLRYLLRRQTYQEGKA